MRTRQKTKRRENVRWSCRRNSESHRNRRREYRPHRYLLLCLDHHWRLDIHSPPRRVGAAARGRNALRPITMQHHISAVSDLADEARRHQQRPTRLHQRRRRRVARLRDRSTHRLAPVFHGPRVLSQVRLTLAQTTISQLSGRRHLSKGGQKLKRPKRRFRRQLTKLR